MATGMSSAKVPGINAMLMIYLEIKEHKATTEVGALVSEPPRNRGHGGQRQPPLPRQEISPGKRLHFQGKPQKQKRHMFELENSVHFTTETARTSRAVIHAPVSPPSFICSATGSVAVRRTCNVEPEEPGF